MLTLVASHLIAASLTQVTLPRVSPGASVSQTVGAMGPAAYASEPNLTITTLYPEDESIDLTNLMAGDLDHPLLFNQGHAENQESGC